MVLSFAADRLMAIGGVPGTRGRGLFPDGPRRSAGEP